MPDRTVLITGCASGIGNATARAFHDRGWAVYATDDDPDELAELEELGCETRQLDVTDEAHAREVVDEIDDEHGRIDFLFNNTGYGQLGTFEEIPPERLQEQFDVNFFGMHRLVRAALPVMREQDGGTILNMSSIYGRTVFVGHGAYCATKWAVEAMSDTLRSELSDHDVDVVLVEPGPVETKFGERALAGLENLDDTGAYPWFDRLYDDRSYIDRAIGSVQPEDVADVVLEIAEADDPDRRYPVGPWRYRVLVGTALPKPVRDVARDAFHEIIKRVG